MTSKPLQRSEKPSIDLPILQDSKTPKLGDAACLRSAETWWPAAKCILRQAGGVEQSGLADEMPKSKPFMRISVVLRDALFLGLGRLLLTPL